MGRKYLSPSKYKMPRPLSDVMGKKFDPAQMGPGFKRGMVLYIYKAKIRDLVGEQQATHCLNDLQYASMTDRNEQDYQHPILYLHFTPGSLWRAEMRSYCWRLKDLINKRLKSEFLRDVRVK